MTTLSDQIKSDLTNILSQDFGESITHHYGESSEESLNVIFDRNYYGMFEGVTVESAAPSILLRTADAGNITKSSSFTISSTTYYVYEIQQLNDKTTRIILSEQE